MEIDRTHLLENDSGEDNRFFNIREKIKRPNLGNETAWDEAQGLLAYCVNGFPATFNDNLLESVIHPAFNLRRDAFLRRDRGSEASVIIQEMYNNLDPQDQERVGQLLKLITNFFDIPSPSRRFRRSR